MARPIVRFCGYCGQDLMAPGADLVNGKKECRPCANLRRRVEYKRKTRGTGIPTDDKKAYKREYMKRFRAGKKRGITPADKKDDTTEWSCPECGIWISKQRIACPFCEDA